MYSKHRAEQCTSFDIHCVYKLWRFIGNHEYLSVEKSTGCAALLPVEIFRLFLAVDIPPYFFPLHCVVHMCVLCCVVCMRLSGRIRVCVCLELIHKPLPQCTYVGFKCLFVRSP